LLNDTLFPENNNYVLALGFKTIYITVFPYSTCAATALLAEALHYAYSFQRYYPCKAELLIVALIKSKHKANISVEQ